MALNYLAVPYREENRLMRKQKSANKFTRIICTLLAVCLLCCAPAFPAKAAVVENGIDVSKYQGAIDWQAVAQSGISFAFIKVGSTKSGIDPYFNYNMLAAQQAGIKTGVYIYSYAKSVEEAVVEAQFVLNAIQNVQVSYPVVWDVEDNVQKSLSPETLSLMANTFCAMIEAEGYYPMVYSSTSWFNKRLGPVFYDKWVAQWAAACEIPDASIWQYSCKGSVPGIKGDVDLDYALKDYSTSIVNTGWVPRKGYLYFYINYKMQRGWLDLGTAKYYLDPAGRMVTGWLPLDDAMYYLHPDGVMAVGFTPIGPGMYCFNTDGKMLTGLQNLNGLTYYFAPDGAMYVGLLDFPDGKRFFSTDGHMLTGLSIVNNKYYYFDLNGIMQTGWQTIGGQTFLFTADGSMAYGWFNDGIFTYYLSMEDGHRVSGWQTIDGKTYCFDANGVMLTGWQTIGDQTFLFAADGSMVKGWFNDGAYTYYLSIEDGHRVTGWQTIDGKTYLFDQLGHMMTGVVNLNGLSYLFAADGVMYTGWFNDGVTAKYYEADGHMAIGMVTINDSIYYFDINGNMQTGIVEIGGVPYLFDVDGKMLPQPAVPQLPQ